MRILFVGLHPPHTGGIATATFYLKRHLEKRYHEVFVLTYDFPKKRFSGIRFLAKVLWNTNMVKKENIDLIHAHYLVPPGLAGLVLKWVYGKPLVVSAHGSDVNYLAQNFFGRILCCMVVRFSDSLIANSLATQKRLTELGGKSEVIYLGVDKERFFPKNDKREAILFVGALTENKCVSDLIEAACGLGKIWIVGDGPERGNLERLAEKKKCDCTFFGFRGDVENFMRRALVLVLPSLREGFGLTVIEALSCATPVLARRGSGIDEILEEKFLFESNEELRGMLQGLIEDRDLHKKYLEEAKKTATTFDWDDAAGKTEDVYERIAAKSMRNRGLKKA